MLHRPNVLLPSEAARLTLEEAVVAERLRQQAEADRIRRKVEQATIRGEVERAGYITTKLAKKTHFDNRTMFRETDWIENPAASNGSDRVQVSLESSARVTRRGILGIPAKTELNRVHVATRFANSSWHVAGKPEYPLSFMMTDGTASILYDPSPETESTPMDEDNERAQTIRPGTPEWQMTINLLNYLEKSLDT